MSDVSFPKMVWRLAEEHHDGNMLEMSRECDIPQSTLWRWTRGLPGTIRPDLLKRLCETYELRFADVWDLVAQDGLRRAGGKKILLPDFSGTQSGPKRKLAVGAKRKR